MLHYVKGILAMKLPESVVIECQGVGFEVSVPSLIWRIIITTYMLSSSFLNKSCKSGNFDSASLTNHSALYTESQYLESKVDFIADVLRIKYVYSEIS